MRRPFTVIVALLVATLFAAAACEVAPPPDIWTEPEAAPAGTAVPLWGHNFVAGSYGTLTFDDKAIGSFVVNPDGRFQSTITIPSWATAGEHLIHATAGASQGITGFTVAGPAPTPTTTTTAPSTTTTATTTTTRATTTTGRPTTTTASPTTTTTRRPTTTTSATTTTTRGTTTTSRPTTTTARPTTTTTTPPANGGWWRPTQADTFQWQLSGTVDQNVDATVYDIDGESATASLVASLKAKGRRVVCYIDAGAAENYRSDFGKFPASTLGKTVGDWPDERWIDIRQIDALTPVMAGRVDMCKAKGFDAVEFDMIEGYQADTGFPLTYGDQLVFNRWLADLAHSRGMGAALKQDIDQVKDLHPYFDFAINEQCAQYNECDQYKAMLASGKAVFQVEYNLSPSQFCAKSKALGTYAIRKRLSLDAWRETCPA